MNRKDLEFLNVVLVGLGAGGFRPPYEFTQRSIRANIRNFYGYTTDKSIHSKFKQFLQEGLFVQNQFCFQLTEKAIKLAGGD